jgi:hypothetical protein
LKLFSLVFWIDFDEVMIGPERDIRFRDTP